MIWPHADILSMLVSFSIPKVYKDIRAYKITRQCNLLTIWSTSSPSSNSSTPSKYADPTRLKLSMVACTSIPNGSPDRHAMGVVRLDSLMALSLRILRTFGRPR